MPTRSEKAAGHAAHMLDAFLRLRETYAMLEPVLFDGEVVGRWGAGPRARGRQILINTLLYSSVLEAAKIALDSDPRAPSLANLDQVLDDARAVETLREAYAVWNLHVAMQDEDAEVAKILEASERRDEAERRQQFDRLVAEFRARWATLKVSTALASFRIMRDKLIAHTEVRHEEGKYAVLNVATLKLKYGDLGAVVRDLEPLVNLATLIFRAVSFDFVDLDDQLGRSSRAFWAAL